MIADNYSVTLYKNSDEYWDWCRNNLKLRTWRLILSQDLQYTYCFDSEADLLAFELRFNLYHVKSQTVYPT